ncbi:hypothetical protein FRB90_003693 [Tulasnella sp. 427]|nr:hypothetical protein FRB90_003693 [Tulasnella sp. 427]
MSHPTDRPLKKPTWKAPEGPPNWADLPWNEAVEAMQSHLQTAVILELYTIPMYLYAAYSVNGDASSSAMQKIISVVMQEMLHLGLAGNTLCAIGGTPRVYGDQYTPKYPRELFFEKLEMNLLPATKDTIKMFMEVEEPYPAPSPMKVSDPGLLPTYNSIGQFYQSVIDGLITLDSRASTEGQVLWQTATSPRQFQDADGSWLGPDSMTAITNIDSAKTALNLIIVQGEGNPGGPSPDGVPSHYEVFKELYEATNPVNCWPVVQDIDPDQLKSETFYPYSYLLLSIETLWQYDGPQRGDVVSANLLIMMTSIIKPVAQFLVQQQIKTVPNTNGNAAFPYRRYDFKSTASALGDLRSCMNDGLAPYPNLAGQVGSALDGLIDLKTIMPNA